MSFYSTNQQSGIEFSSKDERNILTDAPSTMSNFFFFFESMFKLRVGFVDSFDLYALSVDAIRGKKMEKKKKNHLIQFPTTFLFYYFGILNIL